MTNTMDTRPIFYPDNGGYTGFSLFVWINEPSDRLTTEWGSVEGTPEGNGPHVLEGRFFVFGILLERVFLRTYSLDCLKAIRDGLEREWKPLMDKVLSRELDLAKEENRTGIPIDEIVDNRLRITLASTTRITVMMNKFYGPRTTPVHLVQHRNPTPVRTSLVFIAAASMRHAELSALKNGLRKGEWKYINDEHDLDGREGEVILYETWLQHPKYFRIAEMVDYLIRIGRLKMFSKTARGET